MSNTISIQVLADVRKAVSNLESVNGKLGSFGKSASKLGGVLKGAFAGLAVGAAGAKFVGFMKESVQAASDLEQSTGAVEAVFGKQAGQMKKYAEGAAQAMGLSKNSYQELATTLGAGLKNQGIKDFAGETQKVIGLGADLAAQFGGSTKDAVEAISSLMRGEADPIERYGVGIKQSAVNAELAARGQSKLTGAAKTQAEAQARLALLFKQTGDAQGAFAREGETLATMQQKNAAAMENLKAKLGTILLPVMTKVANFVATTLLPAFERLITWLEQKAPPVIAVLKNFFDGIKGDGTAAAYLGTLQSVFGTLATIVMDLFTAISKEIPTIMESLKSLWSSVKSVFDSIAKLWSVWGPTATALFTNVFKTILGVISGAVQVISGLVKVIVSLLTGDWKGAWQGARQIVQGQMQIMKSVVTGIFGAINATLGGSLTRAKNIIVSGWNSIKSKTVETWNSVKSTVSTKVGEVVAKIKEIPGKVKAAFSNAGTMLLDAGRRIIRGLLDGINERIGAVRDKLNALTDMIPDWKGPASKDARLLYNAGQLIMQGLVRGFDAGESGVKSKLAETTKMISKAFDGAMSPTLTPSFAGVPTDLSFGSSTAAPTSIVNHYTIEIHVPQNADKVEFGRLASEAISEYERAGGRKAA